MNYSSVTSLSSYLSVDEERLPDDIYRMMERASETIEYFCLNNIDMTNDRIVNTLEKATNAQVEYWLNTNDELGIMHVFNAINAGSDISIDREGQLPELAPRAKRELLKNGLLNVGV